MQCFINLQEVVPSEVTYGMVQIIHKQPFKMATQFSVDQCTSPINNHTEHLDEIIYCFYQRMDGVVSCHGILID